MKNIVHFSILFFSFFLASCGNEKKEKIPAVVLPIEKMRDVVASLNLSEAIINQNNASKDPTKKTVKFNVYKENGVSRQQYLNSMVYYSQHPELLKKIYEKAVEKLNVMKER